MSRIFTSSFRQSSSPSNPTPHDPLLADLSSPSDRSNSISLHRLSPQPSRSSPAVSPSPPPSFYRSKSNPSIERVPTLSPSPSRTKGRGRFIQFTGPPPPIATSVLLPRRNGTPSSRAGSDGAFSDTAGRRHLSPQTSRSRRGSGGLDPLLALSRRERALQKDIQELLDAQSAGLIQGFGGKDGSEASEAGSSTPTYNSTRSRSAGRGEVPAGVVPVRQPRKKAASLRGARSGLLRDIGELAFIKADEIVLLEESTAQREETLRKVGGWEKRIEAFQKRLSSASEVGGEEDEEGREIAELRNEEKAVENEIREMEDRLAQMRARRTWIQERVREGDNRREARLSSYRGALREVESEVKGFLRRPPVFAASSITDQETLDGAAFMDLPLGRRTLGMAKELWTREISQIETRKLDAQREREALEEGAKMWEGSISQVMEFENGLRLQMKGDMHDPEMLKGQVRKMGNVIEVLQRNVKVAEDKGWNLLICALGAELEAFREGEGILKAALGMDEGLNGVDGGDGKLLDDSADESKEEQHHGSEELNGVQDRRPSVSVEREDSEDDGPNLAELLVDNSHGDGEGSLD